MIMWIMSDRAIPRSFRFMEGFGVHTFRLRQRRAASRTFVKFHWKPKLGLQSVRVERGGEDQRRRPGLPSPRPVGRDQQRRLSRSGSSACSSSTRTSPTSSTSTCSTPPSSFPRSWSRSAASAGWCSTGCVDNFFAETEQVAFCTQNIVPGIDFTNDPLLQGRNFSYLDTQLKRLGGPNFTHIPINAPKCPFAHFQQDGHMAMTQPERARQLRAQLLGPATGRPARGPDRAGSSTFPADEDGRQAARAFGDASPTTTARRGSSTSARPRSSRRTSSTRSCSS